jgi:hypothetical protein
MKTRQARNLLDKEPAPEEPNLWLSRQTATLVPLRREVKDEAIEGIRAFLARAAATQDKDEKVSIDDVYPFRAIAASNGVDSYFTSQNPKTALGPMAKDFAAGRSVLGNHDYGTFSYGSTTSGEVVDAEIDRPEYEASFYDDVLKRRPELATSKWLMTDGYVIRGLDLNGNKSDSIIQGMRLGGIRRISISFTVGRYTCGIDGQDMLNGWFGDPWPAGIDDPDNAELCQHFPGIDYGDDGFGYADMHGNRALEESLVYMNASPSAMLMRKAAVMAERGVLSQAERSQVESRFGMRLPAFNRRIHAVGKQTASTTSKAVGEVDMTIATGMKVRWADESETETTGVVAAIEDDGTLTVTTIVDDEIVEVSKDPSEVELVTAAAEGERLTVPTPGESEVAGHLSEAYPDGHGLTAESDSVVDLVAQHDNLHADPDQTPHVHGTVEAEAAAEADPEPEPEPEPTPEPEPEPETASSVTAAYVVASQAVVAYATRTPEAFTTADSAEIYAAERSIEQALVDLSAERSVGADVSRQHEAKDRVLSDVLGGDLTVTRLRQLMAEASDGRQAKADLIRDAVAARVGVHAETFDAKAYTDMLQTQPMAAVRSELESWQTAKRARFTPGRSVIPRDITKEGKVDKRAPARPAAEKAAPEEQPNILSPRS